MIGHQSETDERVVAVNHAAGYYAYQVMSWLLLLAMMVHGLRAEWTTLNGFPIDILAVIAGGAGTHIFVTTKNRTVGRVRAVSIAWSISVAALVGCIVALVLLFVR